jgi:hypothetical protein
MTRRAQVYWLSRLQPCHRHGDMHCYVQENGDHISWRRCQCDAYQKLNCPIDAHRIPWTLEHPEHDDLPKLEALASIERLHLVAGEAEGEAALAAQDGDLEQAAVFAGEPRGGAADQLADRFGRLDLVG